MRAWQGRPRTAWVDNNSSWTGLPVVESVRMTLRTEINGESRFMVWPTLRSRTAKKQNRIQGMRNRLVRRRAEFHSVNLQFTGNFVIASINAKLKLK